MGLGCYLAMTAAEFSFPLPPHTAWMACHFSSSSEGLSNLPERLPPDTMLILDDSTPFAGHDANRIKEELENVIKTHNCKYLLLDLQRPGDQDVAALCRQLTQSLPCPVIVSEDYGKDLCCPVFVSPPPLLTPLEDHLAPWEGRELWLEAALDRQVVMVTETGSSRFPCVDTDLTEPWFLEESLFCRYRWILEGRTARFTILRTKDDLSAMLNAAEVFGVKGAVGLYQELQ